MNRFHLAVNHSTDVQPHRWRELFYLLIIAPVFVVVVPVGLACLFAVPLGLVVVAGANLVEAIL